jgi:hypothetical protein
MNILPPPDPLPGSQLTRAPFSGKSGPLPDRLRPGRSGFLYESELEKNGEARET